MEYKTFTIKIKIPVIKDKKTKTGYEGCVRYNVSGMKTILLRSIKNDNDRYFAKEYVKFCLMDMAGIKMYPLGK